MLCPELSSGAHRVLIGCSSGAHRVLIGCSSDARRDVTEKIQLNTGEFADSIINNP